MTAYNFPSKIRNDFDGYSFLLDFYNKTKASNLEKIGLDFKDVCVFEPNIAALLGAILNRLKAKFNVIEFKNLPQKVKDVFKRNHFLGHFGEYTIIEDRHKTTIEYKKFKTTEGKLFRMYIDKDLFLQSKMPRMSDLLKNKISTSIFEIFDNAIIHGRSENIFSCGQYYPKQKRLDFTIVNVGITIQKNVNTFLKKNLTASECIAWAAEEGNTTKKGAIPGGLGIVLIREFVKVNRGRVQIVSADGYWEQNIETNSTKQFSCNFPGTIVNLEFSLKDKTARYCLASEIDTRDLF